MDKQKARATLNALAGQVLAKTGGDLAGIQRIVTNALATRAALYNQIYGKTRQVNSECGWPDVIGVDDLKALFDRDGLAARIVSIWPEECFKQEAEIVESEDSDSSDFEDRTRDLIKKYNLFHYLERADTLSGVARFGILLIGMSDGFPLDQPVGGGDPMKPYNKIIPAREGQYEITYLRTFDEPLVQIAAIDTDETSPRYGQPTLYNVTFTDPLAMMGIGTQQVQMNSKRVHWTRVLHLADNKISSEILGLPRLTRVFNRVLDIIKVLGASAQGYWSGAFPGISLETIPDIAAGSIDVDDAKEQMENYMGSLQRYLALDGIHANSLAVQVADPKEHLDVQMQMICLTLGIPKRVFLGSEQAELASTQDRQTWSERVAKRREQYVTPCIIRPFIDRLIAFGILPTPVEGPDKYDVQWPDLDSPNDDDRASTALKWAQTFSTYVSSGADQRMPPEMFFTLFCGLTTEQVEAVTEALEEHMVEVKAEEDEQQQKDLEMMKQMPAPAPGAPATKPPSTKA